MPQTKTFCKVGLGVLALLLAGCHANHKPARPTPPPPSQPQVELHPYGPASIVVNPYTGWTAAPAYVGVPVYTNNNELIAEMPDALNRTLVIQRKGGFAEDLGYLNAQVTVPTNAMLYMAIQTANTDGPIISDAQLRTLASEGWWHVPGPFRISGSPDPAEDKAMRWSLWAHPIERGAITITSDAIPMGGIFFIGKQH